MKKLNIIVMALLSVLFTFVGGKVVMADDASAVPTYTLTLNGTTKGHTYEVYQIFAGDLSTDGTTLTNISWGSGVKAFNFNGSLNAAVIAESLGSTYDSDTAKSFATEASAHLNTAAKTVSSTATTTTISGLTAGYYLVKDKDESQTGENSSYTRFIMQVVGNSTATLKSDVPSVEKKVKDTNDTLGITTDWQDSADHDINDTVPFQLTATLPSNLADYKEYYLELSDTLSAGLTYNKDAKVYLVNGDSKIDVTSSFTIAEDGSSFKINNLKSLNGDVSSSKVVVAYTATLNENAVIGSAGNPNTVKLIYSNNPNYTGTGDNSPKGETPKDTVIVFTYKAIINKVDKEQNPLSGAEFTLSKVMSDGSLKEVAVVKNDAGTTFTFSGLDDGNYILSETKVPNGYNKIEDIEFTVMADHDVISDNPQLKSLSGVENTALPQDSALDADGLVFTPNTADGSLTANVVNKKGSVLPSTGGKGTAILYTLGGVLVLSAGIFLSVKKFKKA